MARGLKFKEWFRCREDYDRVRQLVPNAEALPLTFDDWQKGALETISKMEKADFVVRQIVVDPMKFAAWPAIKPLPLGSAKRAATSANSRTSRSFKVARWPSDGAECSVMEGVRSGAGTD
jgi:hypothetical protein